MNGEYGDDDWNDYHEERLYFCTEIPQSYSFGGISQNTEMALKDEAMRRERSSRHQNSQYPPNSLRRGIPIQPQQEEEEPLHPALAMVEREMALEMRSNGSNNSARSSPSLFKRSPTPRSSKPTCADNLQAIGNSNASSPSEEVDSGVDLFSNINQDEILERFRKECEDAYKNNPHFFDNSRDENLLWIKDNFLNSNKPDQESPPSSNQNCPSTSKSEKERFEYLPFSKHFQESEFELHESDFPPLTTALDLKPSEAVSPSKSSVTTENKCSTKRQYFAPDLDEDFCSEITESDEDCEETFTAIPKPSQQDWNVREAGAEGGEQWQMESKTQTSMWVNALGDKIPLKWTSEPNCSVVIRNIPEHVTEEQLLHTLSVYGKVTSVIFCDLQEGMKVGIVEMLDTALADEVVDMFQDIQMFGNPPEKPLTTVYYSQVF